MPLAFPSLSHGTIAFGFYNIETDGLLLDRLFFSCTDFCRAACELEGLSAAQAAEVALPGYEFERPGDIGDLMGAIHGTRHVGYLGEIYRLWPFPADPGEFRQKLRGGRNRETTDEALRRWAKPLSIPVRADAGRRTFRIGPYAFSRDAYAELLLYVWRGGYPTWEGFEEGRRPACVTEMARTVRLLADRVAGSSTESE